MATYEKGANMYVKIGKLWLLYMGKHQIGFDEESAILYGKNVYNVTNVAPFSSCCTTARQTCGCNTRPREARTAREIACLTNFNVAVCHTYIRQEMEPVLFVLFFFFSLHVL